MSVCNPVGMSTARVGVVVSFMRRTQSPIWPSGALVLPMPSKASIDRSAWSGGVAENATPAWTARSQDACVSGGTLDRVGLAQPSHPWLVAALKEVNGRFDAISAIVSLDRKRSKWCGRAGAMLGPIVRLPNLHGALTCVRAMWLQPTVLVFALLPRYTARALTSGVMRCMAAFATVGDAYRRLRWKRFNGLRCFAHQVRPFIN